MASQRARRDCLCSPLLPPAASRPQTWENPVASSAPLLWGRARPTCTERFGLEEPGEEVLGAVLGVQAPSLSCDPGAVR